jgi:hypothetical protein
VTPSTTHTEVCRQRAGLTLEDSAIRTITVDRNGTSHSLLGRAGVDESVPGSLSSASPRNSWT